MKFNFKVGEYVQLYRRQINPLGGVIDFIPVKGSVGKISDISNNGKMVTVSWKGFVNNGGEWIVHPHNLKRITKEFHDKYGEIVEEVKEIVKADDPYTEFKKKSIERNRLCAFIINGREFPGHICYAPAFCNFPINEFKVFFHHLKEEHLDYVDFIINESVFKDFFIEKDANKYPNEVLPINTKIHKSYGVLAACVAIRSAHEYKGYLEMWHKLVKAGVEKNFSILIAQLFRQNDGFYRNGDGHSLIGKVNGKRIKDFVEGKFNKKAGSIFAYVIQDGDGYRADIGVPCAVYEYLAKKKLITNDRYGYTKQNDPLSDGAIIKMAKDLYEEAMK